MATDLRLSVGDGDVTDDVGLEAGVSGYGVVNGTFSAPYDPTVRYRIVSWIEDVRGSTGDDLWAKIAAINTKLAQAGYAAGPYGHGTRVTLSMKFGDASNYVYADVIGGSVDITPDNFFGPYVDAGVAPFVAVTLICEPFFRGAAVTTTVSGTIANSDGTLATPGATGSGGLFIAAVPGDVPALARYVLTDTSSNSKYINRLRLAAMWMPDPTGAAIAQSDYDYWYDDSQAGSGAGTADATAHGGVCSRITLGSSMQRGAFWTGTAAYARGLFDVYLRLRDSNTILGPPTLTGVGVDNDVNMYVRQVITGGSASSATFSPTWGTETKAGSAVLLGFGIGSRTITITTPSGWTAGPAIANATAACRTAWFYINPGASRSGVETITTSSAVKGGYVMYEIVGAAAISPVDVIPTGEGTSPTLTIASGTLAQAREMIFAFASTIAVGTGTVTSPGFSDATTVFSDATYDVVSGYCRSTTTTTNNVAIGGLSASGTAGALISIKQAQNLAPSIPVGSYDICVVAAGPGGTSLSPVSNAMSVTVTQTDCVIFAEWELGSGTADHHRLYYRIQGGAWEYYASAASTGTFTAYTIADDAGSVADPPTVNSNASNVRIGIALSSGTTVYYTQQVQTVLGGSRWELVYVGTVPLPPLPAADGGTQRNWTVYGEASHPTPAGTLDFDSLILIPHQWPNSSYVEAESPQLALAALSTWRVETRRDGQTFGLLTAPGTDTEAGQLDVIGDCYIGPGDTWITPIVEIGNGVHDLSSDVDYLLSVTYSSRFIWPRGT